MIVRIDKYDSIQHPCIYEDEEFSVYVEDNSIGWLLHCYVKKWSKSVYEKMLHCMVGIIENAPNNELYALSNNSKLTKFATMFGMESIDTFQDAEGNEGDLLCLTL